VSTSLLRALLNSLEAELPQATLLRERLHASPEPSHEEHETARLVTHGLGTAEVSRVAGTGLVARAGPDDLSAVAVRAELDALPMREETGVPFAATNGLMHACGHDVHMAALAALLRAACRVGGSLPKPLLALYQPSEEAHPLGADLVVREGTLASAAAIVAAHVHPEVPWGAVSVEPGPVNASLDFLRIVVEGAGGHGAYPHKANDPIFALSNAIVALQSLVSRRLDPMHPGVLTIGWTRAGTTENVIPSRAEAGGTLRVLEPADRAPLQAAAREVVENVARAHGCSGRVEMTEGEPATVNDPYLAERARSLLDEAGFDLAPEMRSCGSDDFGFYGRFAPALMVFVGIRDAPGTEPVPLHHPRFLPPDEAVKAVACAQAVAFAAAA
jgi:amidohydrolase